VTTAISRSLWVFFSVLVPVVLWEMLTFEFPPQSDSVMWRERLNVHLMLAACITLGSLVGSFLAFWFFPPGRVLKVGRLFVLGGILVLILFFATVPLILFGGITAAFIGSMILALIVVQVAGRLLAQNGDTGHG